MKKVAIHTLGCRANQLESSIIADKFTQYNCEIVDFNEVADIYIINTCTVTSKSDNTSRYFIKKARKNNPDAKIIVAGCYSQVSPEEVAKIDGVDLVLGNMEKLDLAELIMKEGQLSKINVSDIMQEKTFKDKVVTSAMGRTRANIKIQDGCNYKCSYCIISTARGRSRSNPLENVLNQVREITEKGYKEVVLSGIHLGQWGLDFSPKNTLAALLKEIEKIETLHRYRISSIDPMEFSEELIETLINSKKFCRHLHISLQSGNNEILKAMKRRYSVEYYSGLINKLAGKIPHLSVGSDIIVGFPGETEKMFRDTCNNLEKLPISYIHIFSYSKRKGTPAALMPNQIDEKIKKIRNAELKELADRKNLAFRQNMLNNSFEVMIEKTRDKKTGFLKGMTDNFIPVLIDGNDNYKNELVKAKIIKLDKEKTFGEIV